ncbi:hypothetical protein F5B20DRAFT_579851 [Whalleya microplaca]|nr:hypothetical protein F5B20DRAFT_579851 [Whalleya microplaca]
MKTSSLVSIFLGICLTGVQADLPYHEPDMMQRDSPPILSSGSRSWHHHRPPPTGTGLPHFTLPGGQHHHPPPTGYPHHPHHPHGTGSSHVPHHTGKPKYTHSRHSTFKTVTGTGNQHHHTGTGTGPVIPRASLVPCKTKADCTHIACAAVMPIEGPRCLQGREGKYCGCGPVSETQD